MGWAGGTAAPAVESAVVDRNWELPYPERGTVRPSVEFDVVARTSQ
jgi:hypothetical protein